jgi:3-hydroxyisobutyrate dehydrogenase-like beta-hydroxyacid dehydrogenase
MRTEIGVASAGALGNAVVGRLLDHGKSVSVYDVRPESALASVSAGARLATVPDELSDSAVVMLALDSATAVENVVFGPRGIAARAGSGLLVIDLSRVPPARTREFAIRAARAGLRWVDAPIPAEPDDVHLGSVSLRLGGLASDVDEAARLLEPLAWQRVHVGRVGNAQAANLIDGLVTGCVTALAAEAAALAKAAGLAHGDIRFPPEMNVATPRHFAELTEILDAARELGSALQVSLPVTSAAAEACRSRVAAEQRQDITGVSPKKIPA